jgi:RNA-directed DNA polymerase
MPAIDELKAAESLHDVAEILGFTPKATAYLIYKLPPELKYRKFSIAKRSGGMRQISAPMEQLMLLQSRLSDLLQNCDEDIRQSQGWLDQASHGFRRGKSIISNAKKHRGKRFVFNVDIENFFESINFGRVRGFFIKNKYFALRPDVATVLAQIACNNNSLPQGSPCSPVISNLVAQILDYYLCLLASKFGCTYSRYVDDITFSTNKPAFPPEIAFVSKENSHLWLPGSKLLSAVNHAGFNLNTSKTRMQYSDTRQEVTGLVVNKKLNTRHEYRHKVRAMAHRLFLSGNFTFFDRLTESSETTDGNGTLAQLHGALGFIDGVDLYNRRSELLQSETSDTKRNPSSREELYRKFLLFRFFYAAPQPLIVCEGKTDNVYLKLAIKNLSEGYPALASGTGLKAVLKVRLFKYSETSTGRILGLNGGTGDFKDFVLSYGREVNRFKAPGQGNPVILLVDNDEGSKKLYNIAKGISGTKPNGTEQFTHISANLYLVTTPPLGEANQSMIEDFFPEHVRNTIIAGKSFNPRNDDFDPTANYGKHVFSQKVIAQNANQIDFSAFAEILNRIVAVIDHHKSMGQTPEKAATK